MTGSRLGIAALAVTTLGATFAAGVLVGRDGDDPGRQVAGPDRQLPVATGRALVPATSCADLLSWYVDNTLDLVTPWGWGWGGGVPLYGAAEDGVVRDASPALPGADAAAPGAIKGQGSSETGTNVQEAGVDEPDVVKTDGRVLVRIDGDDLTTYDVSGTAVRRLSTIDLPGKELVDAELLLAGDQVVVIGDTPVDYSYERTLDTPRTVVRRVDLSDPAEPEVLDSQEYGASLVSARQYGDVVRLVLGTGLPALDFVQPDGDRTEREALQQNRKVVRNSVIEDWLPSVREDGGDPELAVGCDAMSLPEDFSGGGSVVVVGYQAGTPTDRSAMGVATSSDLVYSSTDRLYLATGARFAFCCPWPGPVMSDVIGPVPDGRGWIGRGYEDDGTTDLHAFALDDRDATYVGSGKVEGWVRDRWSMDAVDGTLRVAVGPTSETGNFNSVVTLREEDGGLVEIGRVDRLGVDEEIKAVRWFDDLAIVVTFRQTDPLYAIDLSRPAHPRLLGKLKIPGFSEYLHPIGDHLMIGIGTDATLSGMTRGGQVAVFDLSDLRHPKRVSTVGYGRNRQALAGQDPRQFTWLAARRTALTVVGRWGKTGGMTGWVSVLEVGAGGVLENTMVRGTYGYDDVADLRTVPLPDGRVVMVTEDAARFLAW